MTREEREAIAANWRLVAENALSAANDLAYAGHPRSSVSRSYYAAYAFLAEALVVQASVGFQGDREGPEHEPLADLVRDHLRRSFSFTVGKQIRSDIRALYGFRLQADYRPRAVVRGEMAVAALQKATAISKNVVRMRG